MGFGFIGTKSSKSRVPFLRFGPGLWVTDYITSPIWDFLDLEKLMLRETALTETGPKNRVNRGLYSEFRVNRGFGGSFDNSC